MGVPPMIKITVVYRTDIHLFEDHDFDHGRDMAQASS